MPYKFIVSIASLALVAYFDIATNASWIAKTIVTVLFLFCFASFLGWIAFSSLISLFVLVALGIFIIFYRLIQQAHLSK